MSIYHDSVFRSEAVEHLKVKPGKKYIDCTLGDAGHTLEILKLGGEVLGIDQDPQAIERARARIEDLGNETLLSNFKYAKGNFRDLVEVAHSKGFVSVDGVIYDIGTSFIQLEDMERGFSFDSNFELDMRMDPDLTLKASDLVNGMSEKELTNLISRYGEDSFAPKIAKAIVKARKVKRIVTCKELADLIHANVPRLKGKKIDSATKTFQALRIAINDELTNFDISLSRVATEPLLIPGGRLVIITFHSLEDRLAKVARPGLREILKKPLEPSDQEQISNPRSRSAKLRVFEKL